MKRKTKFTGIGLYPVTIESHKEGGYLASCPVLQGCYAEGETVGEAIDNIRDVIRVHIEARKAFGEFVPSVELSPGTEFRFTLPLPYTG